MTDPIADYLTRLRNAIKASHRIVEIPASNIKKEITKVLHEKGYIQKDTPLFNNVVLTKAELMSKWLIPLNESWLAARLKLAENI